MEKPSFNCELNLGFLILYLSWFWHIAVIIVVPVVFFAAGIEGTWCIGYKIRVR